MDTALNANDHRYSDVINRQIMEFSDTPGGAPPGVVVEAILKVQETEKAMSTGTTQPLGEHRIPLDSEDAKYFTERVGHEPNLWMPEDSVYTIVNGVNTRQEMGDHFTDWHAAAFGFTGMVTPTGMKQGVTDDERKRGAEWMTAYLTGMSTDHMVAVANTHAGAVAWSGKHNDYVVVGPDTEIPETYHSVTNTNLDNEGIDPQADLTDMAGKAVEVVGDAVGVVTDWSGELIGAVTGWAPRIMLFLVGAIVLGFGVYRVFRG